MVHPMGAKLFHVDSWTSMTKLIVAFHNFVNVPNIADKIGLDMDRKMILKWHFRDVERKDIDFI
jgi:hypothetical protein